MDSARKQEGAGVEKVGAEEKEGFSATSWLGNKRGVSSMRKWQLKKRVEV